DETGDGSLNNPYATIGKAVAELPENPVESYVISINPGIYTERVNLVNSNRIWNSSNNLTIKARYNNPDSIPLWQTDNQWACLFIEDEDYITIQGIRFKGKSGDTPNAVWIRNGSDNISVKQCYFLSENSQILNAAVKVELNSTGTPADNFTMENCIVYGTKAFLMATTWGVGQHDYNGYKIVNNTFYRGDYPIHLSDDSTRLTNHLFANNIFVGPTSGYALYLGGSKIAQTITMKNCLFYDITTNIERYPGSITMAYDDTLMRNPSFSVTDSTQWSNTDFMMPTIDTVLNGGFEDPAVPLMDFYGLIRLNENIPIGAVGEHEEVVIPPPEPLAIYVDDDGSDETGDGSESNPYATIGKAMDQLPGMWIQFDTAYAIVLFPGTYTESIHLEKAYCKPDSNITIKSYYTQPESMAVWQSASNGCCLILKNTDYAVVEKLKFIPNGTSTHLIKARGITRPTFRNCYLLGKNGSNTSDYGIASTATGGCPDSGTIENCIFYRTQDYAIWLQSAWTGMKYHNKIINNTFYHCANGIKLHGAVDTSRIHGPTTLIANNIIDSCGTALFLKDVSNDSFRVYNNLFKDYSTLESDGNISIIWQDTLLGRNPSYVTTDTTLWITNNFLKPTLDTVLSGGFDTAGIPGTDFYGLYSLNRPIGAVGAQDGGAGKRMSKRIEMAKYPNVYKLHSNMPNPFNPITIIKFDIPAARDEKGKYILKERKTVLNIYDVRGRLIKTLVNDIKKPGYYTVLWHGKDNFGKTMSSGLYIYQIISDRFIISKKMTFMK
ncbi:MAG: right-handed parallel beta-helix repeat-containing protein, partial [bacterium]